MSAMTKATRKTAKKAAPKKAKPKKVIPRSEMTKMIDSSTLSPIQKNICRSIKIVKEQAGMNVPDFAAAIGVSPSNVTGYLQHRWPPSHQTLYRIARKFKRSLEWMYGEDETDPYL
jgi:ribosome-binding protein aMBF1 (putative translation factor)